MWRNDKKKLLKNYLCGLECNRLFGYRNNDSKSFVYSINRETINDQEIDQSPIYPPMLGFVLNMHARQFATILTPA